MSSRDEILARLRAKEGQVTPPPAWRTRRHFEDLAERFTTALTSVHGEVIRAANLAEATESLSQCLGDLGAKGVVANAEPLLLGLDLPQRYPEIEWHIVGQTGGDLRVFCASADVGLSSADAALAETGTVVISSGPGRSRLATLLPPVHIALVPTTCLTTDIFTWTAARQGALPSALTLITGPSKTADIEQTLAIGVHGPKRFMVILYET